MNEPLTAPAPDSGNAPEPPASVPLPRPTTPNERAWRRFKANRPAVISLAYVAVFILVVLFFPVRDPNAASDFQFAEPGAAHWFGTDALGRDVFARVLAGARISLLVGAVGACVALGIGVTWGAVSGYIGGRVDGVMMRVVDVMYSLPTVVFVIVLVAVLNACVQSGQRGRLFDKEGMVSEASMRFFKKDANQLISDNEKKLRILLLFAGIGAVSWLTMARIVRGQVLSLKNRPFMAASRSLGATHGHMIRRHILPNISGVVITYLTLLVPAVVLYESFLSYLGMGVQPPMASWGTLIAEGARQLNPVRIRWWLLVFPGVTMIVTLLALNFVGDGLRDAFDPKGREA